MRHDFRGLIRHLPEAVRGRLLGTLSLDELAAIDGDWPSWAHAGQLPPAGDWQTWVIKAGRGFGKTRAGAEWIAGLVAGEANAAGETALRIALVGATIDEARRVMIDGTSGLLNVAGHLIERYYPTRRLLRFKNGAEAALFSGASPEALRGPEHHYAWCDELAKWEKPGETWDMLQLGLRLGAAPRTLVTTTPRAGAALARILGAAGTVVTGGATRANPHLPPAFIRAVEGMYAGTRLGRQELDGELLPDVAGALWSVALLERCRVIPPRDGEGDRAERGGGAPATGFADRVVDPPACATPPCCAWSPSPVGRGLVRIVIGVDPPSGDGTCGIVACGMDDAGIAFVLADHSVTARSPEGWARAVAAAAEAHGTREVIAEDNQGGAMVSAVLRAADADLSIRPVRARMGKADRAVPVAARFEAGQVRLCGRFAELEAELCGLIAGGGYEGPTSSSGRRSPDRADAMVWALSALFFGAGGGKGARAVQL